ncbi:tyrosine-type recombinase/integrase [Rhizobiaceae bacterium n13]|uniref:tyrosine-type recombinase/integrase n=1 Tax=Ferirhizobium litorale TaxID=2927786 RepID=UPI0024B2CF7C|nr:tyrosine-type recombinase/integrase [Fererhizobium litorale]MDI7862856.1 tyrosine-type recombinase/integrase [Fererhizobium litorale]
MLSDAKARKLKPGDKPVSDGTIRGLYLFPTTTHGSGKWIFRFVSPINGKRRDMGLGSYPAVSIRDARAKAFDARTTLEAGFDPLEKRRERQVEEKEHAAIPTFEDAARRLHADLSISFRNKKHSDQWINTLAQYVFPGIGQTLVNELGPSHFAACLKPIWLEKPETASRVKQRCEAVMDWCAATGHIMASPVRVVGKLLPKQPGKRERVEHQPALPWRQLPSFFRDVLHAGQNSTSKIMLELLILTASRSGEIRQMRWEEIDFTAGVWTIPAARMKAKVMHRVPLGPRALALLELQRDKIGSGEGLVFPSRSNTPISDMTLTKFLRDRKVPSDSPGRIATAHGFRSSFRDWASENGYPRDVAERALAHTVRNATEAAYHRTDLLEQRRKMMAKWDKHCLDG